MGVLYFVVAATWAHDDQLSAARVWAEPDAWMIELVLDRDVTESFIAGRLDDGFDKETLALLSAEAQTLISVAADGEPLQAIDAEFKVMGDTGIYTARYPRVGDGQLTLTHRFPDWMIPGKGTIIRSIFADGTPGTSVFISEGHPIETIRLLNEPGPGPQAGGGINAENREGQERAEDQPARGWFPPLFFRLGLEHIAFGFDHLLFLGGLLVACRRPGDIFAIVTSFTLAHSITLSVAALDLWVPPGRLVEPAIAASIVFVGVENMMRKEIGRERALLTFAFGLIHGFGFAGVLRELGLGQDGQSIVGPLFAFNVGIEAGQLAIVAIVLPALLWFQHASARVRKWMRPGLSLVIALIGVFWLLQRTVFA